MATTENTFTGNGSTTNYSFTFPYIKTTDVKASINGTDTTAFTLANATTVQFNTAPANSAAIRIYRATDDSALPATFYAGSSIKSSDLNDNFLQNLYTNQETNNNVWTTGTKTIDSSETWVGNNTKVATTGAIDGRVDAKIDTALGSDVLAGTDLIKTVSGGQVTVAHNVNGANSTVNNSNGNVIQDITISAQGHVTSVASTNLDGRYYTETETGSLIDSKIDTAVTSDILAGQSITKTNGSGQVTISIANGAIGTNQIADDAVTLAKLGSGALPTDITVASANIVNGTIVAADISTGTLDGRYYTETELDAGQLDNRYYTETELNAGQLDNRYYTETELNAGQLDSRYYTETEADARFYNLTSGEEIQSGETWAAADNKIATTAAIDARITDLVDDVGGFVPIANETSFPNANPDINNGAGTLISIKALSSNLTSNGSGVATIANGTVGNSTVTITGLANSTTYSSGYGMIVETTTTLNTYTFHRQVPIATEVTTVASNISNINSVANNSSNINSAVSNASNINSAVSNASNINSVAGNISNVNTVAGNNTNINTVAGANSNISTVATNITNVNNVGGSIANVNTVAGNLSGVNSFGERYRVASSAPGSGNDEGDLYFDTTANELKVYNGSAWQGGVTASGNFASTTGNTFTGSNTYQDNVKAQFGTGNDLQIFHDGVRSKINNETGHFYIQNSGSNDDSNIYIRARDDEESIICLDDAGVKLYYDGVQKLETASFGLRASDSIYTDEHLYIDNDTGRIKLGTAADLQIYHDGTNNWITSSNGDLINQTPAGNWWYVKTDAGNDNSIIAKNNGSVELYYDGSKKVETIAAGFLISGELVTSQNAYSRITHQENGASIWSCGLRANGDDDYHLYREGGSGNVVIDNGNLNLGDSQNIYLGDSNDLQIYHDGSHTYINNNTGNLYIQNNVGGDVGGDLHIRAKSGEGGISLYDDASVQLYFDGAKKFETNASGATVFDYLRFTDSGKAMFGAGDDLHIYHDGSHSRIKDLGTGSLIFSSNLLKINNAGNTEVQAQFIEDGAVELYYDGSKKFNTYSGGCTVSGDTIITGELNLVGGSDAHKYLDAQVGTNAFNIRKTTGGDSGHETMAKFVGDGAVELYYDNALKARTATWGWEVFGNIHADDNNKLNLGTGNDLQIYHDGTDSVIENNTGNIYIQNQSVNNPDSNIYIRAKAGENSIYCADDHTVKLYYDGSEKLETTSGGVNVTGALTVNGSALSSGLSEIDMWHLTSSETDVSGNGINHLYSSFSRFSSSPASWAKTGTGVSVDSTGWSFPSTGEWEVTAHISGRYFGSTSNYAKWGWQFTNDNGSNWNTFNEIFEGRNGQQVRAHTIITAFFSISNVSNQKIRFRMNWNGNNGGNNFKVFGSSTALTTYYTFKKIA